jgi:phosphopantetheine--protein transferase-like protein
MQSGKLQHLRLDPPAAVNFDIAPLADLEGDLLAAEAESLSPKAGDRRRREFIAGRTLARRLLGAHGIQGHALIQTSAGAPLWPNGVAGSISHCRDLAFVAVASIDDVGAVGVDIENVARFHDGLAAHILTAGERARLPHDGAARRRQMAICFAAKEAFYKCQFALFGAKLTFQDAEVVIRAREQTLSILMTDAERHGLLAEHVIGHFAVSDDHVATMILRQAPLAEIRR